MSDTAPGQQMQQLSFDELKQVMYDRLHGHQSIGPPIDPRGDIEPNVWLVEQYRRGTDALRDRMTATAEQFVERLTEIATWPRDARVSLLDLIQDNAMPMETVKRLIRSRALLNLPELGPEAHAALLKCTLGQGSRYSPDFWMEQLDLLGENYGALIFGGLLEHGLNAAVDELPRCCASQNAIDQMLLVIPALVDRFGLEAVCDAFGRQLDNLADEVAAEFRQALEDECAHPRDDSSLESYLKSLWTLSGTQIQIPAATWAPPTSEAIADGLILKVA